MKSEILEVFKPGTTVLVGPGPDRDTRYSAVVNQVSIEVGSVSYKVVWWNGRERKEEWFHDHEIFSDSRAKKIKIGFHENNV